jgi:dolichyl-phosphate-mannose--protein O-mannosyl transferase
MKLLLSRLYLLLGNKTSIIISFLLLLSFLLFRLTLFDFYVFDEKYYVEAAKDIFAGKSDPNYEHPILGKWLIGIPLSLFGSTPLSWRLSSVVFGFSGLVVLYFLSRKMLFNRQESIVAVFMLVCSGSWYVLSRLAMLDIFLSFFTLCGAYALYVYLNKNSFGRDFSSYKYHHYLFLYSIFIGVAAACKWSGFFPLLLIIGLYLFYFKDLLRKRVLACFIVIVIALSTYFVLGVVISQQSPQKLISTTMRASLYHTSVMLPERLEKIDKKKAEHFGGGVNGIIKFFVFNYIYSFEGNFSQQYGLSNNQFLAVFFIAATLLLILSNLAVTIRQVQRIPLDTDEIPIFLTNPQLLYCYFYALTLILPWIAISRIQYNFYYVPAFPFIVLFSTQYLFRYSRSAIRYLLLTGYFAFAIYWFHLWIPL